MGDIRDELETMRRLFSDMRDSIGQYIDDQEGEAAFTPEDYDRMSDVFWEANDFSLSFIERLRARLAEMEGQEPYAYTCPAGCGCLWRDNHDDTISLFGPSSKSCEVCDPMGLDSLVPVYTTAPPAPSVPDGLTFDALRRANAERVKSSKFRECEKNWTHAHWMQATIGELGELANFLKKVDRGDFTLEECRKDVENELADVQTYLDILAMKLGVDMGGATVAKFNEVSERIGSPVRLTATPAPSEPRGDYVAGKTLWPNGPLTEQVGNAELVCLANDPAPPRSETESDYCPRCGGSGFVSLSPDKDRIGTATCPNCRGGQIACAVKGESDMTDTVTIPKWMYEAMFREWKKAQEGERERLYGAPTQRRSINSQSVILEHNRLFGDSHD